MALSVESGSRALTRRFAFEFFIWQPIGAGCVTAPVGVLQCFPLSSARKNGCRIVVPLCFLHTGIDDGAAAEFLFRKT